MADNKDARDGRDRAKVSASEPYEVEHFAQKHGINQAEARRIIQEAGPNRADADAAAERLGPTAKP